MILNYNEINKKSEFKYDYCIIGAGVSGIIIADQLKKKFPNKKICILECGDFFLSNVHNKLKDIISLKLPIKKNSREFAIGGSTNTWGGLTSHFSKYEFDGRDFIAIKKWPFKYDELKHYYQKVSKEYGFINTLNKKPRDKIFKNFDNKFFGAHMFPINYKDYIPKNIDLIYNARVISLISNKKLILNATITSLQNKVVSTIAAQNYFLTAGGLENLKLLMNSLKRNDLKLGKEKKSLGRYFMNHPRGVCGILKLNNYININEYCGIANEKFSYYYSTSLKPEIQKKKKLLSSYLRFSPLLDWQDDKLILKFISFLKNFKYFFKLVLRIIGQKKIPLLHDGETIEKNEVKYYKKNKISKSIYYLIKYIFFRLFKINPRTLNYRIHYYIEMEPRFINKVYLSSKKKDKLGQYKLIVDYDLSFRDKKTIKTLYHKLNEYIKNKKIGNFYPKKINIKKTLSIKDSSHHYGGTVIGIDSKKSFINKNFRSHSIHNLYISGSSVMPVSGNHNPTFTISALAFMLVDKFKDGN